MRRLWTIAISAILIATTAPAARAQESNFGRALALTPTELVIGQPVNWYGPGTVYIYGADGSGQWVERTRLVASDSARMDDFGRALAVDGNTLVVGAPRKRDGAGVAYVFQRETASAAWRQVAVIEPPAAGNHAEFATALSVAGDELLIGSPAVDSAGVVYQYRRASGAWRLHEVIRPEAGLGAAGFGRALSRQGDWLLIGAPTADSARGRVYASRRSGTSWGTPRAIALSAIPAAGSRVGTAVLLAGDRAYAGAPAAGSVLVFSRDGAGAWSQTGTLQPAEAVRGSQFGAAIAAVGDEVWVGAPSVNAGNGRVYRFRPAGGNLWQPALPMDADSADGSHWPFAFGHAIASAGDRAVVSMPQRDFGEGRVLAVAREGESWRPRQLLEGQIFAIGGALKPGMRCENGRVGGEFTCSNIEVVAHLPTSALGGERGAWVNDVWGWTDPQTQRDYALVARRDGTSFVDVTDVSNPRLVGNLPRTVGSPPSVWRDIKVWNNHAYIVADGAGSHGMQVFSLARLRGVTGEPALFTPDTTYHDVHSAHNVVADTTSGFLYIVGSNSGGETCGGGLHMVDARNPLKPVFAGCYHSPGGGRNRGYTHDAQCVTYRGPDTRFRGREICVGSNETEINIADVTNKSSPVTLGRNSYPNVAYAHQGWFDEEQRYFYMNDELDELEGTVAGTRTIVWDLTRLDEPIVAREYIGPVRASDHNLFVRGNLIYESNYGSGLRVLDISDRTNPREIGFIDSAPYNDDGPGHSAGESGAWSNYPFFRSGVVIFTSVREGLFIVRVMNKPPIS